MPLDPKTALALAQAKLNRAARAHHDAQEALTAAHARLAQATEQLLAAEPTNPTATGPEPHDLDLDNDPRDPETQAAEFFTRPGDFHQVDLAIPLDDEPFGLKLGAQFVIKFTPAEKPLIVEVLRQLRGALAARITITRMNQTSESDIAGRNSTPNVAIDNGPPIPMTDCTLGQPDNSAIQEATDWYRQRKHAATELGVPPNQLTPIPMSNGQTAWAITKPPPPVPAGRHHKTDEQT